MKLNRHFIATLAFGAIALGATASRAAAEQQLSGSFTLPVEAYWNNTLLEPGEYTITMYKNISNISFVQLAGPGLRATFMTGAETLQLPSQRSRLKLEEVNGAYVVRELDAGLLGKNFRFGVPKAVRVRTDRAAMGTPMNVPVSASGRF